MDKVLIRKNLLVGFLILNILTGTCSGVISMVLPFFAVSINASTAEIGVIKGISGVGALIMVIPSGFLVDHFGSKRLYLFGSIISTLTIIFLPFTSMANLIMFIMAIQGFANSLRFTSLNAAFFSYLKHIGLSKAGWYRGSISIGLSFLGPLVGGYLLTYLSYSSIFYITAILTLLPSLPLINLIKRQTKIETQFKFSVRDQLREFNYILKDKLVLQTVLAEGLSTACFSSFSTFIVLYAINNLAIKAYYSSWFLILEGSAYTLIVFFGGKLLYKYKKEDLYLLSFSIMILGLFLMAISQNIIILICGIVTLGVGTGILNLVTYSNLSNIDKQKGKVSSLLSACGGLGLTLGPVYGGFIGGLFGYSTIFVAYIPLFVTMGIYMKLSSIDKSISL